MSQFISRSGPAPSRAARETVADRSSAGPSWWVRPLLILTTAAFDDDGSLAPRIVLHLQRRRDAGWLIRTAGPRNYVAWRNTRALSGPVAILVLPNRDFGFTHDERNIAVIRDVLVAELRARGQPMSRSASLIPPLLSAIFGETDMGTIGVARLLEVIDAKIQSSLIL